MDNFDLRKYLAEGRLLKEDKPAGYYNAATITSHSDYYDIIITNKEEFFKIQKDPDSFMGEEAEEYLVDLEPGMYQMIYWNDEGPDSMSFDSKLDYVKESIGNFWGEDHFEEKFGIGDILDAAGDNWESAFHKHIEDNLDKYYEELNSLIKNSYPDKDSASGVVLLVNGKEVAGADNGRLTNMLGTADEIKRDMLRENIDPFNVDVFGYKTKYYKVCPGAKAFMDKVMDGAYGDMSQRQNEVIRIAKLHDLLFIRELKALKDPQYAAEIIPTAEYIAEEIKDNVQFLGIPVADVDYVDNHIEIIKDAAKKIAEGKLNENQDDSYYIDEIKRDLEELDDKEANEYLEELSKSILKLKR